MNPFNNVNLLSKFDVSSFFVTGDFQIGHFADFEQFTVDVHFANFGHVKTDPICSHLLTFIQVTVILVSLGMRGGEKQSKLSQSDKNSRTKRRIWHFLNHFQ